MADRKQHILFFLSGILIGGGILLLGVAVGLFLINFIPYRSVFLIMPLIGLVTAIFSIIRKKTYRLQASGVIIGMALFTLTIYYIIENILGKIS